MRLCFRDEVNIAKFICELLYLSILAEKMEEVAKTIDVYADEAMANVEGCLLMAGSGGGHRVRGGADSRTAARQGART